MSRTYRNHNPRMKLGTLRYKRLPSGLVRDGTPQHYSSGCDNHGDCDYCLGNRMHAANKRKAAAEFSLTQLEIEI